MQIQISWLSEANWSGSTLFAKARYIRVQQDKGYAIFFFFLIFIKVSPILFSSRSDQGTLILKVDYSPLNKRKLLKVSIYFINDELPCQTSKIIWAAWSKKVPSKMHRFRSSCTQAKYHPGLCSRFIQSVVWNDSVKTQRTLTRLRRCTGWSGPLLSAYAWRHILAWRSLYKITCSDKNAIF